MAVPPGEALLTCTTSRGDDLRGSVIAMDEKTKVVIISILPNIILNYIHNQYAYSQQFVTYMYYINVFRWCHSVLIINI